MSWITTKLLGYLSGGLGIALLLSGGFAGLQTYRLGNAQTTVTDLRASLKDAKAQADFMTIVANSRGEELKGRDQTITDQSNSIDALARAAKQNRSVYTAGIAKADVSARSNEAQAAQLSAPVSMPADKQCEAARQLIIEEMRNVR